MKKILFSLLITLLLLSACFNGDDKGSGVFKPSSAGKLYEVLVVVEPDLWKTSVGENIEKLFMRAMDALPQIEPIFDVINIQHSSFNNMFKSHRNILNLRISENVDSVGILILRDYWASPQLYVEITANNSKQFDSLMQIKGIQVLNLFLSEEKSRLLAAYKKLEDQSVRRKLIEKNQLVLNVPSKYTLDVHNENFAWISHETAKTTQGILIWQYPYRSEKQLEINSLILARDSVLLKNVPGGVPESYMATEHQYPPVLRNIRHKGFYALEMRGLWIVEGDFMGGPFVNLTLVDTLRNRIITIEGFVYAGKQNKRNLLRELEAIIYTIDVATKEDEK